jgi:hypothetical protein
VGRAGSIVNDGAALAGVIGFSNTLWPMTPGAIRFWPKCAWPRCCLHRNYHRDAIRPWRGGALAISLGLAYTAFSEWYNVYEAKAWSYSPHMPLVGGIGVAPMLQWFVVPGLMIIAIRRLR